MASTFIWIDDIYELHDATAWNIIFSHGSLSILASRLHPVLVIRPAALTALWFSHICNDVTLPGHITVYPAQKTGISRLCGVFCFMRMFLSRTGF